MSNNYEENKEVTKQLEAIFDKLDEVCHNSEISRTDAFNEQVIYILFARLLGRLDMKKSLFVDDLKHLKWDHILNSSSEEQMRLINGLPTREEQEKWETCPWMNMFQFFRSGLKNTYLKGIASCFQEVECRITNPSILSEIIKCVDEMPIDKELLLPLYNLVSVVAKVKSNRVELNTIFSEVIAMSPFIDLIPDLVAGHVGPSSNEIVCDPACSNGILLTKVAQRLASRNEKPGESQIQCFSFDSDIFSAKLAAIYAVFNAIKSDETIDFTINCINPLDRQSKVYINHANYFDKVVVIPPFGSFLDTEIVPDELDLFAKIHRSEILYLGLTEHILKPEGLGVVCMPSINLVGSKTKGIREQLVEHNQLEAVIFFTAFGMEHALLVFKKDGTTDNVLFYKIKQEEREKEEREKEEREKEEREEEEREEEEREKESRKELNEAISAFLDAWKEWQSTPNLKNFEDRKSEKFYVPKDEIVSQQYILAFEKYHVVNYSPSDSPKLNDILDQLNQDEEDIKGYLKQLNQNLRKKNV
ncbi:MAG: N-6 DNA methylase [Thermoguttaceae bacterium]|nr:N-6 DNA methylase [Thermoguttaceae bacterium]